MHKGSMLVLADNVMRLMADRGDTQTSVAERGGISQRAVGYVVTFGKTHQQQPTLRTVDGLARAFEIPAWMLFIPDLPLDLLKSQRVAKLVENYRDAPEEGRESVDRIAESEVRYGYAGKLITTGK
jgi:transcriptional regulator with XRE-family HTH domain